MPSIYLEEPGFRRMPIIFHARICTLLGIGILLGIKLGIGILLGIKLGNSALYSETRHFF